MIPFNGDPYQNVYDDNSIKSVLLSRLANSPGAPMNAYSCCAYNSGWLQGEYLQTPDPDELDELFQKIAKKIQMRLTK